VRYPAPPPAKSWKGKRIAETRPIDRSAAIVTQRALLAAAHAANIPF